MVLWGLPLTLSGLLPYEPVVLAMMCAIGVGNALVDIGVFTLPARLVPEELCEVARRLVERRRPAGDDDLLEALHRADLARDVIHVLLVHDQDARPGGVEDVGDPGAACGIVDGNLDGAGGEDAEPRVQELRPRRHHHGDAVALADAHLL